MDKKRALTFLRLVGEFSILCLMKHFPHIFWLPLLLVCLLYGRNVLEFFPLDGDVGDDEIMFPAGHLESQACEGPSHDPSVSWMNAIISKLWRSCLCPLMSVERVSEMLELGTIC